METTYMTNLIATLETHRKLAKISKKDMCAAADITVDYYIKVVADKHSISLEIVAKMADYMGLELKLCLK